MCGRCCLFFFKKNNPSPSPKIRLGLLIWCGRRDSNSHDSRHSHLKAARLPISPRPHTGFLLPGKAMPHREDGILARNLIGLQVAIRCCFRAGCLLHRHRAENARSILSNILLVGTRAHCDGQSCTEENRCGNGRRTRQEVRRSGGAENGTGSTRPESGAQICALAVLQQHENDDGNGRDNLHDNRDAQNHLHVNYFPMVTYAAAQIL